MILSIYFRYFFAMMWVWEICGLPSSHSSILPGFNTRSRWRRRRSTKQLHWQYASSGRFSDSIFQSRNEPEIGI